MRIALNVAGVVCLLVGCIWFLQGIDVLPGSFMTGQKQWAVYGAIAACIGVAMVVASGRLPRG